MSADNQQERLRTIGWIVGFTDGEGCFSVSIFKNKTAKIGMQVMPEFVITQGKKSLYALEEIQNFFQCGKIYINHRYDNHHEHLYRYCVRSLRDLKEKIIPFFEQNPLRTAKNKDFQRFKKAIGMMDAKMHLDIDGVEQIRSLQRFENPQRPHAESR